MNPKGDLQERFIFENKLNLLQACLWSANTMVHFLVSLKMSDEKNCIHGLCERFRQSKVFWTLVGHEAEGILNLVPLKHEKVCNIKAVFFFNMG